MYVLGSPTANDYQEDKLRERSGADDMEVTSSMESNVERESDVERERDFQSELSEYISSTEGLWLLRTAYIEGIRFAQISFSPSAECFLQRFKTDPHSMIPELGQVNAEYLLCVFQEIFPYMLKPATLQSTPELRDEIMTGRSRIVFLPRITATSLSKRYDAGLLRNGQIELIKAVMRASMCEMRGLICRGAGCAELTEAFWQARGALQFFFGERFRSERLELLILRHLEEEGPVDVALVGGIREKTFGGNWLLFHWGFFQDTNITPWPEYVQGDARCRHLVNYNTELIGILRGLQTNEQRKA
ncbi:hypothetical protein BJ508DRAFT_418155 [Ascobolus immersus RN42]|uniref:Uncharacterized protein n=1 Tax=Ascobolus immersus RN42 TaxID=1160509 RepID=A0A3N4I0L5_ASCIM|nr:hypothetical protein BJ508DRAFT_418155 [Ascobolus immersus RN42]